MRRRLVTILGLALAVLVVLVSGGGRGGIASAGPLASTPAGLGFIYQGQLKQNGTAVNNTCDFQFALFDALTGGTQIGTTQSATLQVATGLYSITLNPNGTPFGATAFQSDARWLEVRVGCPSGSAVATLSPREPLVAVPYAVDTFGDQTIAGMKTFTDRAVVGGTSLNPSFRLQVIGPDQQGLLVSSPQAGVGAGMQFYTTGVGAHGWEVLAVGNTASQPANRLNFRDLGTGTDVLALVPGTTSYAVQVGDMGCGPNYMGISLSNGPRDCGSYAMVGNTQDLIFNRPTGGAIDFRSGNASSPSQMNLDSGGVLHTPFGCSCPPPSDARLKTHVAPLDGVLDRLGQVRAVTFDWNEAAQARGFERDHAEIGVIAQEIERVFPEVVGAAGEEQYRTVNYGALSAVAIEALKELRAEKDAEIAGLRAESTAHQTEIQRLQEQVAALQAEQATQQAALAARVAALEGARRD